MLITTHVYTVIFQQFTCELLNVTYVYKQVEFVGEAGCDTGGLTREFFTLLAKDVTKVYMDCGTFKHNSVALQVMCIHQVSYT